MSDSTIKIVIAFAVLLISVIIHEICHAASAYALGDPTGKEDGRLSFNPLRHIDFFNTILLPIITLTAMGFAFGGAKPVRINPFNFRNPSLGMALTALAGPVSNIILAVLGFAMLFGIYSVAPNLVQPQSYNAFFFGSVIFINLLLAVFNLIPIPPLDGSRILRYFLPSSMKSVMDMVEPFGLFALIFLIRGGGTGAILQPFLTNTIRFMATVFSPDYTITLWNNIYG